jgi:hypothetical protein
LRHRKKIVTPIEYIPDEIPSNRRQIKQLRNDFIQKWADDARNIYTQNHIIHSPNTYSDQMTHVDFKKNDRHKQKSTHHRRHHRRSISSSSRLNKSNTSSSSSSSLLNELYNNKTKGQSSSSTSLSSIIENQLNIKHKNASSNNSAIVYLKPKKSHDNMECKIS